MHGQSARGGPRAFLMYPNALDEGVLVCSGGPRCPSLPSECQRFVTWSTHGVASDIHTGLPPGAWALGTFGGTKRVHSGTFGYIRVHSGTFGYTRPPSGPPRHPRKPTNLGVHSVRSGYIRRMHPSL